MYLNVCLTLFYKSVFLCNVVVSSMEYQFLFPLMNSFNKTAAAIFPCRLCFLSAFPFLRWIYFRKQKKFVCIRSNAVYWDLPYVVNYYYLARRHTTPPRLCTFSLRHFMYVVIITLESLNSKDRSWLCFPHKCTNKYSKTIRSPRNWCRGQDIKKRTVLLKWFFSWVYLIDWLKLRKHFK